MKVFAAALLVLIASAPTAQADPSCIQAACGWGFPDKPFFRAFFAEWVKTPAPSDYQAAYPAGVHGVGKVDLTCTVKEDGRLTACRVLAEAPRGKGFGKAALTLTPLFQTRGFDPPLENMSFVITFEHQGEPFTITPENCLPPSCVQEPSFAPAKP